jgi:leader peptidase (prepilin peptidase) / N-methyltransferase
MDIARDTGPEPRSHASGRGDVLAGREGWVAAGVCLVAALCFLRFGFGGEALVSALFAGVLVVLTAIDIERRIVPNKIVLPATGVILVSQLLLNPDRWLEFVLATLGAGLFLFVPRLLYPAGMGLGDVKLAMLLGAGLGASVVLAFVVGLVAGFVAAVFLLVTRGSAARKMAIPFVPFLALGGLVALFLS